ncbi:Putative sodium:alanine symporter [Aromatoleum petrolei]|nr:alanine:cation symporter family protein [Aromatoleum petrolei]QTQ37198.1 Putative sodium:alanine symporter [Aromatoleum petrolei]
MFVLRIVMMAAVTYDSVRSAGAAWDLGDIGVGILAWPNIIAILILPKPALIALRDYEQQKKEGKDPEFRLEELAIRNADFWVNHR